MIASSGSQVCDLVVEGVLVLLVLIGRVSDAILLRRMRRYKRQKRLKRSPTSRER